MKKLLIFLGLLLVSLGLNGANAETIVDSGGNGDFISIEEALQFAVDGDTISVWDGNYSGHFSVDVDNIEIIGNGSKTVIQGNDTGVNNIVINADEVKISDFTITGGDWAIYLEGSLNSQVLRNNITNNGRGICLYGSASYNLIEENTIVDNTHNGIFLKSPDPSNYTSHSNEIKKNIISQTNYGIYLEGTTNTEVSDNVIQDFGLYGIRTISTVNDAIDNNTITGGGYGIFLTNSYSLTISKNTIFSIENYGIWATGGQLATDYHLDIGLNSGMDSIWLGKLLIDENEIHSSSGGIKFSNSMNNEVLNNRIYNHTFYGLEITSSSDNITVKGNNISSNSERGLYIFMSSSIELSSNDFMNNKYGIFIRSSSGNYVHENLLSKNIIGIYLNNVSYSNLVTMNNFSSNTDYGIFSEISVNATSNYWGDVTGPYHEQKNPSGLGDRVSDNVDFAIIPDEEPYRTIESSNPSFFEGKTALFLGTFALTNYFASKWIIKGISKTVKPVDKIAKWAEEKRREEKENEKE